MGFCLSLRPLSWCLGSFCPLAGMMHHGVRLAWHQLPDLFYPVLHWGKISTITSLCIRSQQPADIVYKIPYCPVVSIAFLGQISILHPSCQRGKTSRHVLPEWIVFKSTLLMYANTTSKAGYIPAFLFPDTCSLKTMKVETSGTHCHSQTSFYRDHSFHIIKYAPCQWGAHPQWWAPSWARQDGLHQEACCGWTAAPRKLLPFVSSEGCIDNILELPLVWAHRCGKYN